MNTYLHLLCEVKYNQVASFLLGKNEDYVLPWLYTKWITNTGFRIHPKATILKNSSLENKNPRISNIWIYQNSEFKYSCVEYLICNGKQGCKLNSEGKCAVQLKLLYSNKSCSIFAREAVPFHGSTFIPNKKLQTLGKSKLEILGKLRDNHRIKPTKIQKIFIKRGDSDIPSRKQISNLIHYERNKEFSGNLWEDLLRIVRKNPEFIVYPKKQFDKNIIIIKFGPLQLTNFLEHLSDKNSVLGLDAQYKNNKERYPLHILCAQDAHFHTVPGFLIFSDTAKNLSHGISLIKEFALSQGFVWKAVTMIDKDIVEKNALENNGIKVILCDFHLMKALQPKFEKIQISRRAQSLLMFKKIQRSNSLSECNHNIKNMNDWCISNNEVWFWNYLRKNWCCEEWIESWVDWKRPGNRTGLFNTNNACESFFKTLLRTHIESTQLSCKQVIKIILEEVIPWSEFNKIEQKDLQNKWEKKELRMKKNAAKNLHTVKFEKIGEKEWKLEVTELTHTTALEYCDCWFFLWYGKACIHMHYLTLFLADDIIKYAKKGRKNKFNYSKTKSAFQDLVISENSAKQDVSDELSDEGSSNSFENDLELISNSSVILSSRETRKNEMVEESSSDGSSEELEKLLVSLAILSEPKKIAAHQPKTSSKTNYRIYQEIECGAPLAKRQVIKNKKYI